MHRRLALVVAVLLSIGILSRAESFAMQPGECLTYRIYLAGLSLGEERMTIKDGGTKDGQVILLLEQTLDSYPSVFGLVDYHERRLVLWNVETGLPLTEEATVIQRRAVSRERFSFDRSRQTVTVEKDFPDGRNTSRSLPVANGTQTGTTLLYHLRTFPWESGSGRIALLGGQGTEWYSFQVETEKTPHEVPFGRFEHTYHLTNAELKYDVWFDRGPGHLPLEIRSRRGPGLASARLVEARNYK